jgi:putative hemolysin
MHVVSAPRKPLPKGSPRPVIGLELAIVLLLIVLNGVLAMSELAIVSARTSRLEQRARAGDNGARIAIELAEDPNKFLSTVQIGITLIGIINGAYGGATLSGPFADLLGKIPGLESYADQISAIVVVLVITYLSLIIGELVPKQLALQRAETFAAMMAPAMKLLAKISAPIVWFLSVSSDFVLGLLRAEHSDEPAVTEEEVKILLKQATDAGVFERAEQELVSGVFGIGDRTAGELMTPRHQMVFLDVTQPEEVHLQRMAESGHGAFPVCEGSTDNVVGVVTSRNLWRRHLRGESTGIRDAIEPALFVPEIAPVLSIVEQMRDRGTTMAIVIDEYGGVEGILTFDDIFGDVVDEIGAEEGDEIKGAHRRADGSWLLDGGFAAHEVRELFNIRELDGEDEGRFETVGGFVMDQLGRIPEPGESVNVGGYRIEVVDMDGNRIDKVLISPIAPHAGERSASDEGSTESG